MWFCSYFGDCGDASGWYVTWSQICAVVYVPLSVDECWCVCECACVVPITRSTTNDVPPSHDDFVLDSLRYITPPSLGTSSRCPAATYHSRSIVCSSVSLSVPYQQVVTQYRRPKEKQNWTIRSDLGQLNFGDRAVRSSYHLSFESEILREVKCSAIYGHILLLLFLCPRE